MKKIFLQRAQRSLIGGLMMVMLLASVTIARSQTNNYEFNDSHFHLTNNIQLDEIPGKIRQMLKAEKVRIPR
jgi:hypothetical protein